MSKIQNRRLARLLEAEEKIMSGQSYTIGNRTLTRASLATVQKEIDNLIAAGATVDGEETETAGSVKRVVLMD